MRQYPLLPPDRKEKQRAFSKWLAEVKLEQGCADCGIVPDDPALLHFDHLPERGPKRFNVSGGYSRTPETVLAEMEKCQVVCVSCHARRGFARGQLSRIDERRELVTAGVRWGQLSVPKHRRYRLRKRDRKAATTELVGAFVALDATRAQRERDRVAHARKFILESYGPLEESMTPNDK